MQRQCVSECGFSRELGFEVSYLHGQILCLHLEPRFLLVKRWLQFAEAQSSSAYSLHIRSESVDEDSRLTLVTVLNSEQIVVHLPCPLELSFHLCQSLLRP